MFREKKKLIFTFFFFLNTKHASHIFFSLIGQKARAYNSIILYEDD